MTLEDGSDDGFVIGVDGGGTQTRLALALLDGTEVGRRTGPAGLIDPRDPGASAAVIIALVRRAASEVGLLLPAEALCAGLAGSGVASLRDAVSADLLEAGLARRVAVVHDGEVARDGALGGDPGILLAAGTGSVAYGRAEDGRTARCGGWGALAGDEGSAWSIGRSGLRAALRAADGRGPDTALAVAIPGELGLGDVFDLPAWIGRASKGDVAALAPRVLRCADDGDAVAGRIVDRAAGELALHVETLLERLGPWTAPVPVVLHGGLLGEDRVAGAVMRRLGSGAVAIVPRAAAADAVVGAVRHAIRLAGGPGGGRR
jgi:glucosamine kinase